MNIVFALLEIFFKDFNNNFFELIENIDVFFTITSNAIDFSKFDRVNIETVKEIIGSEQEKQNLKQFNKTTKLFFIIHSLIVYFIKGIDDQYTKAAQQLSELYRNNMLQDARA
jgi:hypothetical protein